MSQNKDMFFSTGLPKAVNISHIRALFASCGAANLIGVTAETDVVYSYLPMYHSSGGQLGIAFALLTGNKTVIKRKFSASSFWKDCCHHKVTVQSAPPSKDIVN